MAEHAHTESERHVIRLTVELANAFRALERLEGPSHPSHGSDVAGAIHVVQRVVAMRLARRVDPETWAHRETATVHMIPVEGPPDAG